MGLLSKDATVTGTGLLQTACYWPLILYSPIYFSLHMRWKPNCEVKAKKENVFLVLLTRLL